MSDQTPELRGIVSRLERLERQNRRMKQAGLAVLVVASAIVLTGQTRTNRTIQAEKFELIDSNGKTRAELTTLLGGAYLMLYGPQGTKQREEAQIGISPTGPYVALTDSHAKVRTSLGAGDLSLVGGDSADSGPYISLLDKQNYMTVIGSTDLVTPATGETHKTSAASVVLFGKDKNVLWSAP
jgi:hypothetical protein